MRLVTDACNCTHYEYGEFSIENFSHDPSNGVSGTSSRPVRSQTSYEISSEYSHSLIDESP